jgi:hypothetical protein
VAAPARRRLLSTQSTTVQKNRSCQLTDLHPTLCKHDPLPYGAGAPQIRLLAYKLIWKRGPQHTDICLDQGRKSPIAPGLFMSAGPTRERPWNDRGNGMKSSAPQRFDWVSEGLPTPMWAVTPLDDLSRPRSPPPIALQHGIKPRSL